MHMPLSTSCCPDQPKTANSQLAAKVVPPAAQRVAAVQPAERCKCKCALAVRQRLQRLQRLQQQQRWQRRQRQQRWQRRQRRREWGGGGSSGSHNWTAMAESSASAAAAEGPPVSSGKASGQLKRTTAGRWHSPGSRWAAAALYIWRQPSGRLNSRRLPRPTKHTC